MTRSEPATSSGGTPISPAADRVSTLELFFDLIFVFTITQLTVVVSEDVGWLSVVRAGVLLALIYWMYGGYAWLTNAVAPNTMARRVVLLTGMAAFLSLALAVPRAFDPAGGLPFGLAYLVVVVVHLVLFNRATSSTGPKAILVLGRSNGIAVALVLVGAVVGGPAQLALWATATIFCWIFTTYSGTPGAFTLGAAHFVERHGLIVIVAIGESVVAIAVGLTDLPLSPTLVVVATIGLGLSAGLWWAYFGGDDRRAEQALLDAAPQRRAMMAIEGYGHAHLALLFGVVLISVAEERVARDPFQTLPAGLALALSGGTALYLVGDVWFRNRLGIGPAWPRLLAATLATSTVGLGLSVAALAQLAALVLVLVALFGVEARATPRTHPMGSMARASNAQRRTGGREGSALEK